MKIKRFFAQDMRTALRLVREEQGPNAVILSNRRVEGGGPVAGAWRRAQDDVGCHGSLVHSRPRVQKARRGGASRSTGKSGRPTSRHGSAARFGVVGPGVSTTTRSAASAKACW